MLVIFKRSCISSSALLVGSQEHSIYCLHGIYLSISLLNSRNSVVESRSTSL